MCDYLEVKELNIVSNLQEFGFDILFIYFYINEKSNSYWCD
jgi:hypothetical protein